MRRNADVYARLGQRLRDDRPRSYDDVLTNTHSLQHRGPTANEGMIAYLTIAVEDGAGGDVAMTAYARAVFNQRLSVDDSVNAH